MATYALSKIIPSKVYGSQPVPIIHAPMKASESWLEGAVLIADATGYVAEASADPTADIIGIAAGPSPSATGDDCIIHAALPGVVFEATLDDAASGSHALAQTDLLATYALQVSNGIWFIDENDASNVSVRVTEFIHAVGDVRARVRFVFLASKTIFG